MTLYWLKTKSGEEVSKKVSMPLVEKNYKQFIKDQASGACWLAFEEGGMAVYSEDQKTIICIVPKELGSTKSRNFLEKKITDLSKDFVLEAIK